MPSGTSRWPSRMSLTVSSALDGASSKKGNQWHFGMKAHVGVDARRGLVHTAGASTGKVHDAKVRH